MELEEVLIKYRDFKEIRSIIITGEGDKAFVAGADIKQMSLMKSSEAYRFSKFGNDITLMMDSYPKPIIAAVNGFALGGGCELAMACHIRIASDRAIFGQPEIGLGLIPGFGGTQRLPRIIGLSNAYKLLLTGGTINAVESKRIGLVSDVFNHNELIDQTIKLSNLINRQSPFSAKLIIDAVSKGVSMNLKDALSLESEYFKKIFKNENKDIGIKAFLDKKKPQFKD